MKNIGFPSLKASGKFGGSMRALVFALPLMLAATSIAAEDIKLTDGRILKNAEVSKVDPASITFRHDDGIVRVPIGIVSRELQEKYGFDPQKAAAFSRLEAEARTAQQKQKAFDAVAIVVSGKILQAGKSGFLIELWQIDDGG